MPKHTTTRPIKKPKPKRLWLASLFLLGACNTSMIHVDAIETTVEDISERHDAYVQADPLLSDLEREVYLKDTELLLYLIEEAQK